MRKAFEATPQRRSHVESLAGFGLTQDQIAYVVGCDPKTLRKHFAMELKVGEAKATAKVAQALFQKCMNGDTGAMIFWMKARAKWSERHTVEVSGPEGGPIQSAAVTIPADLSGLSDDELAKLYREKVAPTGGARSKPKRSGR